jgi:hypothetical protein
MTEKEFCIWLKGYIEIHQFTPNATEWGVICKKLEEVSDVKPTQIPLGQIKRGEILGNPQWGQGGILMTNNPTC